MIAADVLVRDGNGNTLYRAEMPEIPYEGFAVREAHVSDSGTLVVTVDLEGEA
jgi:hypothetical protein